MYVWNWVEFKDGRSYEVVTEMCICCFHLGRGSNDCSDECCFRSLSVCLPVPEPFSCTALKVSLSLLNSVLMRWGHWGQRAEVTCLESHSQRCGGWSCPYAAWACSNTAQGVSLRNLVNHQLLLVWNHRPGFQISQLQQFWAVGLELSRIQIIKL